LAVKRSWHGFRRQQSITAEIETPVETRLLNTLQDLMELPALDLAEAMTIAAERIAPALNCDKVDAFYFDPSKQTLRALGTSDTPMGRKQRALGLDVLPLANGGSVAEVFRTGNAQLDADASKSPDELRGVVNELGVRSEIATAFEVNGVRRGARFLLTTFATTSTHCSVAYRS
jgi:hypothetical protein